VSAEAKAVADEVVRLIKQEGFGGSIGAVTPFRSQANDITRLVSAEIDQSTLDKVDFIADTAHGFQGDERDLMLFSLCVTDNTPAQTLSWLSSQGNLFNVALTRARGVLHVFGNRGAAVGCGVTHVEGFARDFDSLADPHASGGDPAIGYYEPIFQQALEDAGLTAVPQHRVNQYRIDLAFPEADPPLAIEIDGEEFHTEWDGSRLRSDQERDIRLMSLGWRIRRYMAAQVRDDTDACVKEIKRLVKK
jgi:very-short-patch-repair endonuclease